MAEETIYKRYLDQSGVEALVEHIIAGDAASLQGAKDYADGLAVNYDTAGAAATAEANAKAYADEKAGAAKTAADAAQDAADAAQETANQGVTDAATAQAAADAAQAAADAAQDDVDALAEFVGEIPTTSSSTTVVEYVIEKTTGIATSGALAELQAAVDAIESDYLVEADKTALQTAIDGVQGAVNAEAERAKGIEGGLETRLKAVEDDYLKTADKTELQGNIDTLTGVVETLRDGIDAEKVDGVKDLIKYVEEHGPEVTGMKEDIADNAEAIEGVAGRMTTAETNITTLQGAVATKAEQAALNEAVGALEDADESQVERIAALEAKFTGEGETVEGMIATAKQEAIEAAADDATKKANKALEDAKSYADAEDAKIESRVEVLEAASATHALASDLTALTTRVSTAESEIDTLQSEMDAVEALAAANETAIGENAAAIALKAAKADLEAAVARIDANATAIGQNAAEIAKFQAINGTDVENMFTIKTTPSA